MWPYSDYWPKAALPIGGRPNVERLVQQLQTLDFERIIVAVDYLERRLRYVLEGIRGVDIVSVSRPNGTADTLEQVIGAVADENLLVVYGDIVLTQQTLTEFVQRYRKERRDALLLATPLAGERAQDWFCARSTATGKVAHIYGHPRPHYVDHRLLGVYAVRTENVCRALRKNPGTMLDVSVGVMPPLEAELEQSLQLLVEAGDDVQLHTVASGAVDLDKPWHLLEANQLIALDEVANLTESDIPATATIHPTAEIAGNVVLGEGVTIGRNVYIKGHAVIGAGTVIDNGAVIGENVVIGKHCSVENYCHIGACSCIGDRSRVGHCAEFQGVMFPNVSFIHYGEVFGVVGTSTDIAAGVTVGIARFDDSAQRQVVNGRVETPTAFGNAVYIGDYTRTGIASQFMPGVKIGSNCAIGPAVVVQKDVPSQTLLYAEQTVVQKPWGSERYGW